MSGTGESPVVDAVRERIAGFLAQSPVEAYRDEVGDFSVPYGSTTAFVNVVEASEGYACVEVWAPVVHDVPLGPELFRFVAESGFMFGRLAVERTGDGLGQVIFVHALLGDTLDPEELFVALGAIATTADDLDDELVARFGGRRLADG